MNKHTFIFTVFLLAAGIIAGCYLCNMIHAYKAEKAAMTYDYNYDYCPYCGRFLLD